MRAKPPAPVGAGAGSGTGAAEPKKGFWGRVLGS